MDSTNR